MNREQWMELAESIIRKATNCPDLIGYDGSIRTAFADALQAAYAKAIDDAALEVDGYVKTQLEGVCAKCSHIDCINSRVEARNTANVASAIRRLTQPAAEAGDAPYVPYKDVAVVAHGYARELQAENARLRGELWQAKRHLEVTSTKHPSVMRVAIQMAHQTLAAALSGEAQPVERTDTVSIPRIQYQRIGQSIANVLFERGWSNEALHQGLFNIQDQDLIQALQAEVVKS